MAIMTKELAAQIKDVLAEVRGRPGCQVCGGHLTVYGTVNTGPDASDGDSCWDCIDWIEAGCPNEGPQPTHEAIWRADERLGEPWRAASEVHGDGSQSPA